MNQPWIYMYSPSRSPPPPAPPPSLPDPSADSLPSATRETHEYWSGYTIPSPGDLPDPRIKLRVSYIAADSLPAELPGKTQHFELPGNPFHTLGMSFLSVHWKDWGWSWNSNTLATWYEELTHVKRPWCWERLRAGGEGEDRGWDGWMASLIQWTWVWVDFWSWWWTGRPGMLQFMGL